jgi:hypothetical protein
VLVVYLFIAIAGSALTTVSLWWISPVVALIAGPFGGAAAILILAAAVLLVHSRPGVQANVTNPEEALAD